MRRTVSSVIGSISGLMFPDGSSDPCTCSRLIFTSTTFEHETVATESNRGNRVRFKAIFKRLNLEGIWSTLRLKMNEDHSSFS